MKARAVDTRLSIDVQVNGRGPYHFIVDSGADSSAIGLGIAQSLQLPLGTPAIVDGMTSRDLVSRVKIQGLTLGGATVSNLQVAALREQDLGADGLLGIDAMVDQRLMMDFENHSIRIEDARIPVKSESGDIVVIGKRRRGQLILTHVRAVNYSLDAVIDTGSELTIGNLALRNKLIGNKRATFGTIEAIGVTGVPLTLELARVDELRIGPIILDHVPIAFADVPPFKLFGLSDSPALLLGTDLLAAFRRVSLDFRTRRVRFQLRRCRSTGIFINTAPGAMFTRLSSNGEADVCN